MKKGYLIFILPIIVIITMLAIGGKTSAAEQDKVTFTIEAPEYAESGQTLEIKIKLNSGSYNVEAFDFMLSYDADLLEYVDDLSSTQITVAGFNFFELTSNGKLQFMFVGNTALEQGDILLYTLTFKVKTEITDGEAEFLMSGMSVSDSVIYPLPLTAVTAGSASTECIKVFSSDNSLKSLTVGDASVPEFSEDKLLYEILVPYETESISIEAEVNDLTATLVGTGEMPLDVGANPFDIVVTAQNGTPKTYTVTVTRAACADNTLKTLSVEGLVIVPEFNKDVLNYILNVPYITTSVNVIAEKNHETAVLTGSGEYDLDIGDNVIEVEVKAQNEEIKTYVITVNRKEPSTVNTLSELKVNGALVPEFSADNVTYTYTVPYEVTSAEITAVLTDSKGKLTLPEKRNLEFGENKFDVVATAEDGAQKTYTVTVVREKCKDNTLKSLSAGEFKLSPVFDPNITEYTVNIAYRINDVTLSAEVNHSTAVLDGTGVKIANVGENKCEITVTAQNGDKKIYTVKIIKEPASTDNTLKTITVNGNAVSGFASETVEYKLNVPFTTTEITLDASTNNAYATVQGLGKFNINIGDNKFEIKVTAEDAVSVKIYTVTINRTAPSKDSSLSSLTADKITLSPAFAKDKTEYTATVPYETDKTVINASVSHSAAKADGLGEKTLAVGENKFTVTVTAQDSTAKTTYTITIVREKCKDNTLKSITVNQGVLTPAFDPMTTEYIIQLAYTKDAAVIKYAVNHSTATVTPPEGEVVKTLEVGVNTIDITVTAQNGDVRQYKVSFVMGEPSKNNTLADLTADGGTLIPVFDKSITDYSVTVPYTTDEITLNYNIADTTASVEPKSIIQAKLEVGDNVFSIAVTAQNGDVRIYTVNVTREAPSIDNTLKEIIISSGELVPAFAPDITEYELTVDYKVTSFTATGVVNDEGRATVVNVTDKMLEVGLNEIILSVTAQNGDIKEYKLNVTREAPSDDATLKSLVPSAGTLLPEFDPSITVYNLYVRNITESVSFDCVTNDDDARTYVSGDDFLAEGAVTVFTVTVTAEDGKAAYYIINVKRELKRNDTTLSTLAVSGAKFEFDPNVKTYDINVPYGMTIADIKFQTNDSYALATLEGDVNLSTEKVNEYKINVTAEDGTFDAYIINISFRDIEANSRLTDIEVSDAELEFDYDTFNYSVKVPYSTSKVEISYVLEGTYSAAAVTGPESLLPGQENEYTITVTAEDATTTTYTVTVFRMQASADSALKWIEASGYELSPAFDPTVTVYSVYLPYTAGEFGITFESSHIGAKVELTAPEELSVGYYNMYRIRVTSETGNTTVYTVKVFKDNISEDSSLVFITTDNGTLSPEFEPDCVNYVIELPYIVDKINLEYSTTHMGAKAVLSGPQSLAVGENIYKISVTAETGALTEYTINVLRADKDDDATLKTLTIKNVDLKFNPNKFEYNITVPHEIDVLDVIYETNSLYASVELTGDVNLIDGKMNLCFIKVTAENGNVNEYELRVFRYALSTDSSAKEITVAGNTLDLWGNKQDFIVEVSYATMLADVNVIANDSKATVEIIKNRNELMVGKNSITVIITAEDGSITQYNITVERDAGSSNAYLGSLTSENGEFNEDFAPDRTNYTITVGFEVEKLVLATKTADSKSTFEISDTSLQIGDNLITIKVTSENGNTVQYKIRAERKEKSVWSVIAEEKLFSIGAFEVSVLIFAIMAVVIIAICIFVLVMAIRFTKKNK